jgi:predicted nucleic acid-binding Zn ribbon protein
MRKTIPMTFGELWAEFVQTNPAARRHLNEARVPEIWAQLVGPAVAARTESVTVERGVMYVRIASSVIRNEIFMRREELKDAVNDALGARLINVVIVK